MGRENSWNTWRDRWREEGGRETEDDIGLSSQLEMRTHTYTQKRPPPSLCVNMCVKSSFDVCVLISEFTPAMFAVEVRAR